MNIVVINGSPHGAKSSTFRLTSAFLEGMRTELGQGACVEVVDVSSAHIEHCRGCFACWELSPGSCVIRDDMDDILPKFLDADVVIWSFPLYYFGLPSKTKALLDRTLPMFLPFITARPDGGNIHPMRDSGKRPVYSEGIGMPAQHVLISTGGLGLAENNFEALLKQFEIMCGGSFSKIICPQGGVLPHVNADGYISYILQAGKEFAVDRHFSGETERKLNELIYPPEAYVEMADANWDIADETKQPTQTEKNINAAERFTRQMAATYNTAMYDGKERVLEMYYTDLNTAFQLVMGEHKCYVRTAGFMDYTTRVETPLAVWQDISKGIYSGEQAMMEGRYKTLGDLKLLISWGRYFGSGSSGKSSGSACEKTEKKTKMILMLSTWFVIWTLLSIDPIIGGSAGIMAAVCIHFAYLKWTLTIYDYITSVCVAGFSLLALLGADMQIIVPASYLCFGLMWLMSCLTPIPLTAQYSKADYNGDDALNNPLFMKTNRILTLGWGLLYLITPIWTYFIMGSSVPYLTALVNSVCPAFMGVFTAWFQKWYPAKIARG